MSYLLKSKLSLIDKAYDLFEIKSFADMGGVWNVEAGYTFYTLDKYSIERAFLVDKFYTDTILEKMRNYDNLTKIESYFGDEDLRGKLQHVDAIYMFDILLHQVKPNWDEFLGRFAPVTDTLLIYNQQLIDSPDTIRLTELPSVDDYLEYTPYNRNSKPHMDKLYEIFTHPDKIHPVHNRAYKDIFEVWQWGITNKDLISKLDELGFRLIYSENFGKFGNIKHIDNQAFIFRNSNASDPPVRL